MVITKNGSSVHPCIQEVIFVTSNISKSQNSRSKRISELPSLRYGPVGEKTTMTGPLRVSNSKFYENNCGEGVKENRGCSLERDKPVRPPRKVRFSLPPRCGATTDTWKTNFPAENQRGASPTATHSLKTLKFAANSPEKSDNAFSQRPNVQPKTSSKKGGDKFSLARRFEKFRKDRLQDERQQVEVPVSVSPGIRDRVHPTGRYIRGTLSPTSNTAPNQPPLSPGGQALLRAARDGDDQFLRDHLRRALAIGLSEEDLNAVDCSGRTILSYIASNGTLDLLEIILQLPGLDPNKPDNEGNTPLHFAAQAGQVECLNCLASRCRGVEMDSRNHLGFTPLMKAALQGRNKCAKLLLFAGANPTLRDNGRGFRADQWARFCGRYVCADVIEKHARQRLLERSTSYGSWGLEHEMGARVVMGRLVPIAPMAQPQSNGLKSKLKKVFRTSSGPSDGFSSARLVTQLTSAALCASSPVLPSTGSVPPVVKSLIRPLTVPRLQVTLVNNNGDYPNRNLGTNEAGEMGHGYVDTEAGQERHSPVGKPARSKKKK